MAINKRKVLQSAQKHLQKGALDKALKDYQTLLQADPKDVNLRLKVGDIHLRQGRAEEAITAYEKVATRFMKDGFDAKAVALYKQITKIDPKRFEVYLPLAELYQRLGLTSDAMQALQTAADARYREGDKPGALDLLRKMATLDPANTTNRLKVAELLRQEGMNEEALSELEEVAAELQRQGENEGHVSVLRKILELEPDRPSALEALGRGYVSDSKWSQAAEIGERLTSLPDHAVEGWEILADAVTGLGEEDRLPEIYQHMAHALRERGDDVRAREIVQRYGPGSAISADGEDLTADDPTFEAAIGGSGAELTGDEDSDPGLVTDSGLTLDSPKAERDHVDGTPRTQHASADGATRELPPLDGFAGGAAPEAAESDVEEDSETELPEGDPDQLLAEASVYLRYGKTDRAIASLRGILAQAPEHRVALERLGSAYADLGDSGNAVTTLVRAAAVATSENDAAGVEAIRARIVPLDPEAAAGIEALAGDHEPDVVPDDTSEADALEDISFDDGIEIEVDDEFDLDVADEEAEAAPAEEQPTQAAAAAPETAEASSLDDTTAPEADADADVDEEVEIELGPADETPVEEELEAEDDDEEPEGDFSFADETDDALEPDLGEAGDELVLEEADVAAAVASDEPADHGAGATVALASESGSSAEAIREELEEANFYFEQGLMEEAEAAFKRVLEIAPNHPQASLRLGEIEAAGAGAAEAAAEEDDSTGEFEVAVDLDAGLDVDESEAEVALSDEGDPAVDLPDDDDSRSDQTDAIDAAAAGLEVGADDDEELDATEVEAPDSFDEVDDEVAFGLDDGPDELSLDDEVETAEDAAEADATPAADVADAVALDSDEADDADDADDVDVDGLAAADEVESLDPPADEAVAEATAAEPEETDEPDDAEEAEVAALESAEVPDDDESAEVPDGVAAQAPITQPDLEAEAEAPAATAEVDVTEEQDDDGESFDLLAELSEAFDEDESTGDDAAAGGTSEEGFEQVFAAFKRGVETQLDEQDYQARYDLGIAYKEMGLYDDAIGEFRVALGDEPRKLECLHLMGLCALDVGRGDDAAEHLSQALAHGELPEEQEMALRFDLGRAFEAQGARARALDAYRQVAEVDPSFQDVGGRIEQLESEPEVADDDAEETSDEGEAFESFDGWMEEAVAEDAQPADPEPAEPSYESFDDLMGEDDDDDESGSDEDDEPDAAEAAVQAAEAPELEDAEEGEGALPEAEPEPAAQAEGEAEAESVDQEPPEDEPPPGKKKKRRKRISFM